jgi:cytochrome c-type biogenesis protein CcmH
MSSRTALAAALLVAALIGPGLLAGIPAAAQSPASPAPGAAPAAPGAPDAAAPGQSAGTPASIREQLSREEELRLRKLEGELRCLVCQNQTLADSDADLAVDLRRQVESLVAEGRSDQQIKDYLVERYGDFVLYRPPVQRNTLALWIGPFVLLGAGFAAWILVQRRSRRNAPPAPAEGGAERERARRLLDD